MLCVDAATRPTAVNLFWGIERMKRVHAAHASKPSGELASALINEAKQVRLEDIAICRAIGAHGGSLVPDGKTVLTHCNAGALATEPRRGSAANAPLTKNKNERETARERIGFPFLTMIVER